MQVAQFEQNFPGFYETDFSDSSVLPISVNVNTV